MADDLQPAFALPRRDRHRSPNQSTSPSTTASSTIEFSGRWRSEKLANVETVLGKEFDPAGDLGIKGRNGSDGKHALGH